MDSTIRQNFQLADVCEEDNVNFDSIMRKYEQLARKVEDRLKKIKAKQSNI